mgnify:CR=1 FL=1
MPTLAGQEDWDDWGQEGDWIDDWEERREIKRQGRAEQGQLRNAPGQLQGGPGGAGASSGTRDAGYPFL